MSIAERITRVVDLFYIRPVSRFVSRELFRYGFCGVTNMVLDSAWYFVVYQFVVRKQSVDFGFVTISPHIASLIVVFPITFFTGFWLNRHVAFKATQMRSGRQMLRYALTVAGAVVLNYACMKFFVDGCGFWATPSKTLTTVISAIYSFLAAKYYTFRSAAE